MILHVNSPAGEYPVTIENGALNRAEKLIPTEGKTLIVTDDGVPKEYAEKIAKNRQFSLTIRLPHGEKNKNADSLKLILTRMVESSFTRKDRVVAVGGGVMGDLAGFAASVYMRGVDFYNVPTTFLSMVDSSIGGKTAIDFCGVKNVVGAFWQPKGVIISTETLKSLPARELSAGIAESIKEAVCFDKELFDLIDDKENFDLNAEKIIEKSLKIKKRVVEEDPTEKGLRAVLNFGHTIGHAIESAEGGRLLHGECVAVGMIPFSSPAVRKKLIPLLKKYDLPTETDVKSEKIAELIAHDKKCGAGGTVKAVFSDEIGSFYFKNVTLNDVISLYEERI